MQTTVVTDNVLGPEQRASFAQEKTYALITIESCVPVLAQTLANITKLFDLATKSLTDVNYADLYSKAGPAVNLIIPNPHITRERHREAASLLGANFMWENALTMALHHFQPKLAQGLPDAMAYLTGRDITPVLITHRHESLFNIVFDTLAPHEQDTIKGLFPRQNRLSASTLAQNRKLNQEAFIYRHLAPQSLDAKMNVKQFAVEVSPSATYCATSHGIDTIAYDLISQRPKPTQSSRALIANGACAVIRHWRDLRPMMDKTIHWPIPKAPPTLQ